MEEVDAREAERWAAKDLAWIEVWNAKEVKKEASGRG
jgi:hypothetical protein